ILASEDVGLADPTAIAVVTSCAAAFDRIGMPEGRYPLAQATLYLATAPKSNSTMGFFDALATVEQAQQPDIPNPMRDASRDQKGFGHGQGYLYPHAYRDHWVAQQYLPSSLQGQVFYQPSSQGYEGTIQTQVARQREAQLATFTGSELPEMLTYSAPDTQRDRWLQRSLAQAGERLAQIRDRLFELAQPQRHHLILDLNAASGLLTWEALRRVPEGGVYALVYRLTDQQALLEQVQALAALNRPVILQAQASDPLAAIADEAIEFDRIIGRNVLAAVGDRRKFFQQISQRLAAGGCLVLIENLPQAGQALYQLLSPDTVDPRVYQALATAEADIYSHQFSLEQSGAELLQNCEIAGLSGSVKTISTKIELYVSPQILERWFQLSKSGKPSYGDHLKRSLTSEDFEVVRAAFSQQLLNQTATWQGQLLLLQAQRATAN
ncbi:MAG: AAA family ATPase, partial [Leptolyngbyaceae cyanobacterium RM2_2_21]|nr:AAA family ATPase [Leptolyngbyaceae cyanobacterium RM2_2_21]